MAQNDLQEKWLTHNTPTTTTDPWGQQGTQPPKMASKNGPWSFWKPHTSDYVAAGAFFLRKKKGPHSFWKPHTSDYAATGVFFFFRQLAPIFRSPTRLTTLPQMFFPWENGPHISGICGVSCGGGSGLWLNHGTHDSGSRVQGLSRNSLS